MQQRFEAANPIDLQTAVETPLRHYLASLDQSGEGLQLLNHIRFFVRKAGLEGELSARELAMEVFHEAVVEALRNEKRFDAERSPKLWLLGIAANVVKRRREKLFRQRKHETVAADLARPSAAAGHLTEEQLFDRLAALQRPGPEREVLGAMGVEQLLSQLSADDRRIIELNILHEMNGNEVAQALGISPGNARVRLHRALSRLRPIWLEQEAGGEDMYPHE
jgi:RNA polymerase sigma-70 factor (ECF subfamily)